MTFLYKIASITIPRTRCGPLCCEIVPEDVGDSASKLVAVFATLRKVITMKWEWIHNVLVFFQHCVSVVGILIILSGAVLASYRYIRFLSGGKLITQGVQINDIRLHFGRTLILGLEFIVAADLIGSTTTPDYYAVGLLAIIVVIRTFLSFSINRELIDLSKEK